MRNLRTLLLLGLVGLAGCSSGREPAANAVAATRAQAIVVSVSPERWELSLDTLAGKRVAYWTESTVFIRGQQVQTNYVLRPGARIEYKGFENRGETWLREVWVVRE